MERELHCSAYLEAPFDVTAKLLADHATSVLQHATDDAADQAGTLTRTLRVDVGGHEVGRDVTIEVGEFEPRGIRRSVAAATIHRFTHDVADEIRRQLEALPDDERL